MLEMDTDTLFWNIKHYVNLRPMASQFPEVLRESISSFYGFSVLYVKSRDDKKSCSLILAIRGKVVLFEVKKGKSNKDTTVVCELPNEFGPRDNCSTSFHPYIQSLTPADYNLKTQEALLQLQSEAEASDSQMPNDLLSEKKATLFKEAAGGRGGKGRVYGSGSAVSKFYPSEKKSFSSSMASSSSAGNFAEFEQKVIDLEDALAREREDRDKAINATVESAVGKAVSKLVAATELRVYNMMKKMMSNNQRRYEDWGDGNDCTLGDED